MKIIIIDDEPLARSIIREYLQNHPELSTDRGMQRWF